MEPLLIFFLPGISEGDTAYWEPFRDVVRLVPLSYLDWPELVKPEIRFEGLLPHLIRQIQDFKPAGAVHLVGYSIGGPLAYACAMVLQSEGRAVDSLTILDGQADYESVGTALRKRWQNLSTFHLRAGLASVLAKLLTHERARPWLRRLSRMRDRELPFGFGPYLYLKLKMQLMWRMFPPWWRKVARPTSELAAPTFLFRSEEHEPWEPDNLGWGRYCRNVTVIPVAGLHDTMLAPENLGSLCAKLVRALRGLTTEPAIVPRPELRTGAPPAE